MENNTPTQKTPGKTNSECCRKWYQKNKDKMREWYQKNKKRQNELKLKLCHYKKEFSRLCSIELYI